MKKTYINKRTYIYLALLVCISSAIYFIYYKKSNVKMNNDKQISESVIEKVNKIIALPSDEVPAIGTIENVEKLNSDKFFASSKLGDRTLIYTKNNKIILYRESENKIINICWDKCEFSYEGFSN